MQYHYVYRITNTYIKKHYYGSRTSSIEPSLDLGNHYFSSSSDTKFITEQKNNPDIFKYKVIRQFQSRHDAIIFEIRLHNKFQVHTNNSFYNKTLQTSTKFSYNATGYIFTDDHRRKLSESAKNRPPVSNETRSRLSKSLSGVNNPMYGKTKEQNPFYGKKHSIETRKIMSKKQSGKIVSSETKQKISNALIGNTYRLGTTQSDEAKKKMSDARKLYWKRKKGLL